MIRLRNSKLELYKQPIKDFLQSTEFYCAVVFKNILSFPKIFPARCKENSKEYITFYDKERETYLSVNPILIDIVPCFCPKNLNTICEIRCFSKEYIQQDHFHKAEVYITLSGFHVLKDEFQYIFSLEKNELYDPIEEL